MQEAGQPDVLALREVVLAGRLVADEADHDRSARRLDLLLDEDVVPVEDPAQRRVEFRVDRTSNLHVPVGKASFDEDKILANAKAFVDAVIKAKPTGAKGTYMKKISISSTMGPGVSVNVMDATGNA